MTANKSEARDRGCIECGVWIRVLERYEWDKWKGADMARNPHSHAMTMHFVGSSEVQNAEYSETVEETSRE